ncbi:hypothetical protein TNCV_4669601 [Trichonephila clavipes]|nr:hypothetical protein TNCV_4669601 [Trichonephila clavipes]
MYPMKKNFDSTDFTSSQKDGRNVSTVPDCWQHWSQEDTISRKPWSNHTRVTPNREDHRILRMVVKHCSASAVEITAFGDPSYKMNCNK